MRIAESYLRKATVTIGVALVLVFFYETTARDSRYAARDATRVESTSLPQAGTSLQFTATAYCKGTRTASGVGVRTGVAAADPALLPVGSVVRLETHDPRYSGVWTVMDTGPAVRGRIVDLYLWSCIEALEYGRRPIWLTMLRLGWNPQHSVRGLIDSLFRKREADAHAPAQPTTPPPMPNEPSIDVRPRQELRP